jgi:predicted small secreted protein
MKKIINLFALIFLLSSCENVQKGLGMKKDVPNEFLIEKKKKIQKLTKDQNPVH